MTMTKSDSEFGRSPTATVGSDGAAPPPERVDGRVLRGLRNRQALVEAYYALAAETLEIPRAADVAERAGVSVRSLFQHFSDLEELRAAVVEDLCQRSLDAFMLERELIDASMTLTVRLDRALAMRAQLWELLRPLRQVYLLRDGVDAQGSTQNVLATLRHATRENLLLEFGQELLAFGDDTEIALTSLQSALSSSNWDHLRLVHRYDIEMAVAVMRHMALAILGRSGT